MKIFLKDPDATADFGIEISKLISDSSNDVIEIHYSFGCRTAKTLQEYKTDYLSDALDVVVAEDQAGQMGEHGVKYVSSSDIAATVGPFFAIAVIQESTFTSGTVASDGNDTPPTTWTFPAGTMLYGKFHAVRLGSGKCVCYKEGRELPGRFNVG